MALGGEYPENLFIRSAGERLKVACLLILNSDRTGENISNGMA